MVFLPLAQSRELFLMNQITFPVCWYRVSRFKKRQYYFFDVLTHEHTKLHIARGYSEVATAYEKLCQQLSSGLYRFCRSITLMFLY